MTQTPLRPWKGRGWDWEADHAGTRWAVRELCSPAELLEETQAQRHCVVTYAGDCAAGHGAIFSVTENGAAIVSPVTVTGTGCPLVFSTSTA